MIARAGGAAIHAADGGRPDGPPVLLVMGLGASAAQWWRLLPHLQPHVRTIVVDNRGTGRSSPVTGPLSIEVMARDLVAVLEVAGLASAHVVGLSLGGMVAQRLALDHRVRVRSLVLAATTAGGTFGRRPPPWRLLVEGDWSLYARRTLRDAPERVHEDRRVRDADATPGWTFAAQLLAAAAHDTRARLPELAGLPVTVLHGEEDALLPPEGARALADGIPGSRLVMIPACGHMLTTDAERAAAEAVLTHLTAATA